ncbi:MAG: tRNA lysidine(34) synthetase TilS, partial [Candidatus Bipolaricaulia bacterium]
RIKETIERFEMVKLGDRVLVAVSGGVDSIVLLHSLYELRGELGITLAVAHLDHRFRREASREDARFVAREAERLKLACIVDRIDVPAYIRDQKCSQEAGAREVRYRFLKRAAAEVEADRVALGHHLDDQVETFFAQLLRGAGLSGLKGMEPVRGRYVRPLIRCSREQIEAFARKRQLSYREDRSNRELSYLRNRIRWEILPLLERYNPNLRGTIARTEEIVRNVHGYLERVVSRKFRGAVLESGTGSITLDRERLLDEAEVIAEMLIREAIRRIKGDLNGIKFVHVQDVLNQLAKERSRAELDLPGIKFERRGREVTFRRSVREGEEQETAAGREPYEFPLDLDRDNRLEGIDWRFSFEVVTRANGAPFELPDDPLQAFIDMDTIEKPLIIRNRRSGDRLVPLGMTGTKKLKDFLIDARIPHHERDGIPLLCDRNGIVWVVGLRIDDRHKVRSETEQVLHITAFRYGMSNSIAEGKEKNR